MDDNPYQPLADSSVPNAVLRPARSRGTLFVLAIGWFAVAAVVLVGIHGAIRYWFFSPF